MNINAIDFHEFIESLTEILDIKDTYTKGHSKRVADFSTLIAREMSLAAEITEQIHISGHLHDIGKIGISESILQKKGKLTFEEYENIKKHSILGYNILIKVSNLKEMAKYVRNHHEKWDGTGYPDQLKGYDIPLASRILAVADSYDAMTSKRSYRDSLSHEIAIKELLKNKWTQFDGDIVDIFISTFETCNKFRNL